MRQSTGDREYDIVVVGGGTAGLVTAAGAASLGARTALVERHRLGGECLWTGCVPSKALVGSARLAAEMRRAAEFGLPAAPVPEGGIDGGPVLASVREARSRIQPHDDPERFRKMGVDVLEGIEARFVSDRQLEAGGRRLTGRRIVLATGSRPAIPDIPGLDGVDYVTHETAFDREFLPDTAVVLGGGAIGVEFAQAYARLGIDVTLVEIQDRILPGEDREMAVRLQEILEVEGIRLLPGTRAVEVREDDGGISLRLERPDGDFEGGNGPGRAGGFEETLTAEELLVATGRRPNVESLRLEAAGVEAGPHGVEVDEHLRTSRRHVYAAGDVIGGHLFTHVADHEARAVVRNALFPLGSSVDYSVVPRAIYSEPALAAVGPTEEEARERHGDRLGVYRYDLADLDRAIVDRSAPGLVKLLTDSRGRLLGGHVLSHQAGSLIVEVALAVRAGLKISELSDLIHPYPTLSEGIRRAANQYYRGKLTPKTRRWLDRWFRVWRAVSR